MTVLLTGGVTRTESNTRDDKIDPCSQGIYKITPQGDKEQVMPFLKFMFSKQCLHFRSKEISYVS